MVIREDRRPEKCSKIMSQFTASDATFDWYEGLGKSGYDMNQCGGPARYKHQTD